MNNPNILIVAYSFPPIPYSGTYRIIRTCKGLSRLGVEVHALSINIDDDIPNDYELLFHFFYLNDHILFHSLTAPL